MVSPVADSINAAEMALGVRRILGKVVKKQKFPAEWKKYLDMGITFLNEAQAGGCLISGSAEGFQSFNGTFSPLRLVTDVYIVFKSASPPDSRDEYGREGKVGKLLDKYKTILVDVKEKGAESKIGKSELDELVGFFKQLFNLLLAESDPIIKSHSQTYAFK
jgi:hypothetical protein